jgi:hypothetical protein
MTTSQGLMIFSSSSLSVVTVRFILLLRIIFKQLMDKEEEEFH